MKRFWFQVLKILFSGITCEIKTQNKSIYFTFDDGPEPGVTPQVLSLLQKFNAKATFFCLGYKLKLYPEIKTMIIDNGSIIANHGNYHFDGFKTANQTYYENFLEGLKISGSKIFRPPYGRITPWQFYKIKKEAQIVMWSSMSMDFSENTSVEKCVNRVLKYSYPGAIIVFHDTYKASAILLKALPIILENLKAKEFSFETIC